MKPVTYSDGTTQVLPGDVVEYKSSLAFWRKRPGRVSYVPGISKQHAEMEYGGLTWVGVSDQDGTFRGVLVDPETGQIKRSVQYLARSSDAPYVKPEEIPSEEW